MVLKAMNAHFVVFWDVPSCTLIHDYQHFGEQTCKQQIRESWRWSSMQL